MAAIPPGPILLVSPHRDDAVLSCEALVSRAEPIDVLTVFVGAPDPPQQGWWDLRCGFADSAESVAARRLEEEAAFAGTPHRRTELELLELQHMPNRPDSDREEIAQAVRAWVKRHPDGIVALPAAAGSEMSLPARVARWLRRESAFPRHPDHVYVRDAALPEAPNALLYEEFPYLLGEPGTVAGGEPLTVEIDRHRKARRIANYASQVPHISTAAGRIDDPAIVPPVERYWLLRPSSSS